MKSENISYDNKMNLSIVSTTKVSCVDKIIMFFPGGEKEELVVNIEADFSKLKPEHHEIFLDSFQSRYNHHSRIFNTHTNHDGGKVPTIVGKSVERKSIFDKIKKWLK